MAQRSSSPREGNAYECDHLRQVARHRDTSNWHHIDGGSIGDVCTSGPYKVDITISGEHTLDKLWLDLKRR